MNSFFKTAVIAILVSSIAVIMPSCKKKPTPPVVTTGNVSEITQTSALGSGNVTADGGAEVTAKGVCWSTSENPSTSGTKTSDGTGTGSFTSSLTSLTPGTKYYVNAYATNSEGTSYGNQTFFTTDAILPATVQTAIVGSITGTSAVSGGTISSDGGGTITVKGVCWATTANPTTSNDKTDDGNGSVSFTSNITGLTPTTTYHVRAYAINSAGTAYGNDLTFTTIGGKPYATTDPATDVTSSSATLKGTVAANYSSTTVTFEFGKTISYGQTVSASPGTITGNDYTYVVAEISGLETNVIYHYRIKAVNASGTTYGNDRTFTALGGKPNVYTLGVTYITSTSAAFHGYVYANYSSAIITFEFGKTLSYGQTIDAIPGTVTGNDYTDILAEVTELEVGTTYHCRIKAVNASGTSYGNDQVFTTLGGKPNTYTLGVTDVTSTSATLNGYVYANYSTATITFEYGKTLSYGLNVSATPGTATDNDYTAVLAEITGLDVGTSYHCRIKAVNAFGTTYGNDQTFLTLGGKPNAYTLGTTDATSISATLNGYVYANYSTATITFEYGKTLSYGLNVSATPGTATDNDYTAILAEITGLDVGTTYHCRIKAVNAFGTTYGNDQAFTTLGGKPNAYTNSASGLTSTSATLNGYIYANYSSTTVTFEYGTTLSYGLTVDASPNTVTGNDYTTAIAIITGLTKSTTYHFRIKAVNAFGTTYGNDQPFTTSSGK